MSTEEPKTPTCYVPKASLERLHAEGSHVAVETLIHRRPPRSGNGVALYTAPTESVDTLEQISGMLFAQGFEAEQVTTATFDCILALQAAEKAWDELYVALATIMGTSEHGHGMKWSDRCKLAREALDKHNPNKDQSDDRHS